MGNMATPSDEIRSLFLDGPPPTSEEVRHILSENPVLDTRRSLISMIRQDELTQHHFGLFVEIARYVQLASDTADELFRMARDESLSMMARQFSVVALTTTNEPNHLAEWFSEIDPNVVVAASDMPFVDMLTAIQLDPDISCDLTRVLLDTSPDEREFLLMHHIGRIRREIGTPATMAYHHPLGEPELGDLHPLMIDAIVQERDATATKLLTSLRDNASSENARKMFQGALLRMGTKQIEDAPGRNAPVGSAYVSICDGQGAFFLVVRYRLSDTHSSTLTCCIRASGEIRDSFVFPQHSEEEFDSLLDEMSAEHLSYTEISIGQAATIFNHALSRTETMERPLPGSISAVVSLFERVEPLPVQHSELKKSPFTRDKLEKLLSLPHYTSWFFDAGDLSGHGVTPPNGEADEAWFLNAAAQLSKTPLKERLLAMLQHMTYWHILDGDQCLASICSMARESVLMDFTNSHIIRLMLKRSLLSENEALNAILSDIGKNTGLYGDSVLRTVLRRRYFTSLKRPSGRHVAELDFTEVTFHQLQVAFSQLPGEKRPREDDVLDIAMKIAKVVVKSALHNVDASAMMKKIDGFLSKYTELCPSERNEVATNVVEGVFSFVDSACQRCPNQCLKHPRKGMADVFFSPSHPALE